VPPIPEFLRRSAATPAPDDGLDIPKSFLRAKQRETTP